MYNPEKINDKTLKAIFVPGTTLNYNHTSQT